MALRRVPPVLRAIYCARCCVRDWPRRERRTGGRSRKVGLVYAEQSREDGTKWTCLGCGARVLLP